MICDDPGHGVLDEGSPRVKSCGLKKLRYRVPVPEASTATGCAPKTCFSKVQRPVCSVRRADYGKINKALLIRDKAARRNAQSTREIHNHLTLLMDRASFQASEE